jgi:mRNA interferase MazF
MISKSFAVPFRVLVTHTGVRGLILLDQIRAADKKRLVGRQSAVSAKTLAATLEALQEMFVA